MRESLLLTFLVLLCYISNQQHALVVAARSRRSIESNSDGNTINDFSSSDNTTIESANSKEEIEFPAEIPSTQSTSPRTIPKLRAQYDPSRWKKIPLRKLVEFGTEMNMVEFLKKYLDNAIVHKDSNTNEQYLIDQNGAMIVNSKNEKVIISAGFEHQPVRDSQPTASGSGSPRSSGIGRTITETFPSKDVSNMKGKQDNSNIVCKPTLTTIPVPLTVEPYALIMPRCLQVERCGGCCNTERVACEPSKSEEKQFCVKKFAYADESMKPLEYVDDICVNVTSHTSCKCQCKTKKEHCHKDLHDYTENECSCECKNKSEYEECHINPSKEWDNDNCQCKCKKEKPCSSGFYYHLSICDCLPET